MKWSIPEKIIEKARTYVQSNRVLSVVPDNEQQVWHADVLGSELYRITLDASAKEEDYCQCPYWEEHHFCKHTVAVELYLRKEGKTRQLQRQEEAPLPSFSPSKMFLGGFSVKQEVVERSVEPLRVEVQIESLATNPYRRELDVFGISLKIGQRDGRMYVVKNSYKFLQIFREQKNYQVNKQHNFYLHKNAFLEETYSFLERLAQVAETQQLLGQIGVQVSGRLDKKYILLPTDFSRELLLQAATLPLEIKGEGFEMSTVAFSNEKPLIFKLSYQNQKFQFLQVKGFNQLYQHYGWGIAEGIIYHLDREALAVALTLEQLFKRLDAPVVQFEKSELATLFERVLPALRKIGKVEVDKEIHQFILDAPLQLIFYLRKKQGKIQLRLDANYGEVTFSSDQQHEIIPKNAPEILRDRRMERRAKQLILSLGFSENETGWEKVLPKKEALYQFFTHELAALRALGELKMGRKLRELYLTPSAHPVEVQVTNTGSWLDIHFDVTGIAENEVDALLESLVANETFFALENGQILSLESESFQEVSQMLKKIRQKVPLENGHVKLALNQSLQLQEQLQTKASFDEEFQQLSYDLTHPELFAVELPKGLQATLRQYQLHGFRWLKMLSHYQLGGVLADEMGLGKTLQMITFLLSEKEKNQKIKGLVVAPASLTFNWYQEIRRFAPALTCQVVHGTKEQRVLQLQEDVDILITSYASLRQDVEFYQECELEYLILDEAQMVKNNQTKTAQALQSLKIPQRFALSGTPIENHIEELWSLFQVIMPGFFPKISKFRELSLKEITAMIQPFILRRDKQTVLDDLPEKLERNYYSALTDEQKKVYLAYLRQMQEKVAQMDGATFRKQRISILAGLTRLRQICCDPRLFVESYTGGSGKLEQLKDLMVAAHENKRRVLIFSQFTSMLSLIEHEFEEMGISSFYLRGSTPPNERISMVDAFNAGERDVFLISLKAGGTGLNLTGADTVILYDLWWNPAVEEQAAGRAHRMGQKKVVEVWRMIAEGTVEEHMDSLQQEKRELFQTVIQGNEQQLQQMTEEDIRLILSIGEEEF